MALKVKTDHAKPPSGGHRFVDGNTHLRGETATEVLSKIETHRAENSQPLGFPGKDLAQYYLDVAPHLVTDDPHHDYAKSLGQKLAEAIMLLWRDHPPILQADHPLIKLRRKECEQCPLRTSYLHGATREGNYAERARQRAALLTSDREFERHGYCSWCELPVDLVCQVEAPTEWAVLHKPPEHCWIAKP